MRARTRRTAAHFSARCRLMIPSPLQPRLPFRNSRRGSTPHPRSRARVPRCAASPLQAVLAALGLAAWGGWSAHRVPAGAAAPYLTLTSPAPVGGAGAQLRVVFTPNLTLSELARLLHSIDANITGGPTEAGSTLWASGRASTHPHRLRNDSRA